MTVLETERLRLRAFHGGDLAAFARIAGDPETMRHLGGALDRDGAWRWIAVTLCHWVLRGFGMWAVEDRRSGELLGRAGLQRPEGWPGLEAAWLIDRARWGEGLAPEAARTVLAFAFESLGTDHVISLIDPANRASIRVAEKIGERLEGRTKFHGRTVCVYGVRGPPGIDEA